MNALQVVGNSASLTLGDTALRDFVEARPDWAVTVRDDDAASSGTWDAVVISPSVSPTKLGSKYRSGASPLLVLNADVWVSQGMATIHERWDMRRLINVLAPQYSSGVYGDVFYCDSMTTLYTAPEDALSDDVDIYAIGIPSGSYQTTVDSTPPGACGFAYEAGTAMPGGAASSRRIGLGMAEEAFELGLTTDGWAIVAGALNWISDTPFDQIGTFDCADLSLVAFDIGQGFRAGWGVPVG